MRPCGPLRCNRVVVSERVVTFQAAKKRNAASMVWSLLRVLVLRGGGSWEVWATTSDGRRFLLRDHLGESDASYITHAFEAQLREKGSPEQWARSKGFQALSMHLQRLSR